MREERKYRQHLFYSTLGEIYLDGNCKKRYRFGKERMTGHNEFENFWGFKG